MKRLTQLRQKRKALTQQYEALRSPYWDPEAGEGAGAFRSEPPTEVRSRLNELRSQISDTIDEITLCEGEAQEERLSRTRESAERVVTRNGDDPQVRAFRQYLAATSPTELQQAQMRAQQVDLATVGGYLALPEVFFEGLIETAVRDSVIGRLGRRLGSVGRAGGSIRQKRTRTTAGKGHEMSNPTPVDATFGTRSFTPRDMHAATEIARPLIRESTIEQIVTADLANAIRELSEEWFHTGNGTDECAGIFLEGINNLPAARWQETATSGVMTADELIDLRYKKLRPAYGRNSTWVVSQTAFAEIRKLQDDNGQFIWSPTTGIGNSLVGEADEVLLGRPLVLSEFAPEFAAGALPIVLGDFQQYGIVDNLETTLDILVDGEFGRRHVNCYIIRSGVDGGVMLDEAFAGLKVKA